MATQILYTQEQLQQLSQLDHPSIDIVNLAEAAQELLLRQAEQGKDWSSAIHILLNEIKSQFESGHH